MKIDLKGRDWMIMEIDDPIAPVHLAAPSDVFGAMTSWAAYALCGDSPKDMMLRLTETTSITKTVVGGVPAYAIVHIDGRFCGLTQDDMIEWLDNGPGYWDEGDYGDWYNYMNNGLGEGVTLTTLADGSTALVVDDGFDPSEQIAVLHPDTQNATIVTVDVNSDGVYYIVPETEPAVKPW